jgi:hypothetical protein
MNRDITGISMTLPGALAMPHGGGVRHLPLRAVVTIGVFQQRQAIAARGAMRGRAGRGGITRGLRA